MSSILDRYKSELQKRESKVLPQQNRVEISDGFAVHEFIRCGLLEVAPARRDAILAVLQELSVDDSSSRLEIENSLNRELDSQRSLRAAAFQIVERQIDHLISAGQGFGGELGLDMDRIKEALWAKPEEESKILGLGEGQSREAESPLDMDHVRFVLESEFKMELELLKIIVRRIIHFVGGDANGANGPDAS